MRLIPFAFALVVGCGAPAANVAPPPTQPVAQRVEPSPSPSPSPGDGCHPLEELTAATRPQPPLEICETGHAPVVISLVRDRKVLWSDEGERVAAARYLGAANNNLQVVVLHAIPSEDPEPYQHVVVDLEDHGDAVVEVGRFVDSGD
jgi:hypothetical protein